MTDHGFGAYSTTDDVLRNVDLKGKKGYSSRAFDGIGGRNCARHHGAWRRGGRDGARYRQRRGSLCRLPRLRNRVELDLSSLASVGNCADRLVDAGERLDFVIANAGVLALPFGTTADGFEQRFGINHLGRFVPVSRIAPLLDTGGRVLMLSPRGHRTADVDLDDPDFETTAYDPLIAYGRSKTADALFAVGSDRRH